MKRTALLLVLAVAPQLRAQAPYLVKDINVTTSAAQTSYPANFTPLGSRVVFSAYTQSTGQELWITDGTEAGTSIVADINRGSLSSTPTYLTPLNGALLFSARDNRGEELWSTDGTSAGTRLIADINSAGSSSPGPGVVYHSQLIFPATDPIDGRELWITDGTPAGTRLLKNLAPGPDRSDPIDLVLFNDRVYFSAAGAIWKTDGTDAGTVKVRTMFADYFTVAGSQIFFSGYSEAAGSELWVTDGTDAGTHMVADILPGSKSSLSFLAMTAIGNRLLFYADDGVHGVEPWISDGTAGGTHLVRDINPGPASSPYTGFAMAGDVAYFMANDGATGYELWRSDGTESGTLLLRDVVPGPASSNVVLRVAMGSKLWFSAFTDGANTLWVTDGTPAGTRQFTRNGSAVPVNITTNLTGFSLSFAMAAINGTLYFGSSTPLTGFEPWKTDGTEAGTTMIANLNPDPAPSSEPDNLIAAGDLLFFQAWDGFGGTSSRSLWRTDGTPEGTIKLLQGTGSGYRAAGRTLFFSRGEDLWSSDGTPAGTGPAAWFTQRFPSGSKPQIAYVSGERLFAYAAGKLWVTTTAPNDAAVSLGNIPGLQSPVDLAGRLLFFSNGGLWTTDGTPDGTYAVVPDFAGAASLFTMNGTAYITVARNNAWTLWKSDGTFEGTVQAVTLPGQAQFVVAGSKAFFTQPDGLWVTDGTTARSLGVRVSLNSTIERTLIPTGEGDRIIFNSPDAAIGTELWISDGTPEGTHLLRDIFTGSLNSFATEFRPVGGIVYFSAFTLEQGTELWSTDGTSDGTRLVADIEPTTDSYPRYLVAAGGRLFFSATTIAAGNELWALPLPAAPKLSIDDARVAEGETTLRFTVTLSPASSKSVSVDFATSDGTATAGGDYDAATGTLTFAPGETSKTISIRAHGDSSTERNETFFVTLRNAAGASLLKPSAFGMIEDDDQSSDLSLSLDVSTWNNLPSLSGKAANSGPSVATNVQVTATTTPFRNFGVCFNCVTAIRQLAPGASANAYTYGADQFQQYMTASISARQPDAQPANNSVAWTVNKGMGMDALYLTPGAQATGWFSFYYGPLPAASVNLESSNPSVVTVPASVANSGAPPTFIVRGVSAGTATIRAFAGAVTYATLDVSVVAPGTKVRFPGGIDAQTSGGNGGYDSPITAYIAPSGTAPYNGQHPTGLVTITANGREIGRTTFAPGDQTKTLTAYLVDIGTNHLSIDYEGDANFLPQSIKMDMTAFMGAATILGSAERTAPATAAVHVRMTGSPMAAPGGTVVATVFGTAIKSATVPLVNGQAELTIPNVPASVKTIIVSYSGDTRYRAGTQSFRILEGRQRSVNH